MKIAVFEITEWEHEACLRLQPHHTVRCSDEPLTERLTEAYCDTEVVTTFIRSDLGERVLGKLPNLRLITTRSTGVDHIDLAYCRRAGVTVCNVPDYGDHTVAEHVFALLLALSRRVVEAAGRTRRGDFSSTGLRGFDLAGKTLGILGAGRIGQRVAAIARGFGMKVMAFDPRPDHLAAEELGFVYAPMEEVLQKADILSLHLPGGEATYHLVGSAELARMKHGAVLINTSRGGVVDAEALVRALASGHLAAAGLDVIAEENVLREEAEIFRTEAMLPADRLRVLIADHALLRMPNVLVTPHIAYDTREAVRRIIDTTLENITAFEKGEPRNVIS